MAWRRSLAAELVQAIREEEVTDRDKTPRGAAEAHERQEASEKKGSNETQSHT